MKNHRFLWLRNRTTNNRKCEKARNIKEKRTIEMFSTVSRLHVALLSSPRDNLYPLWELTKRLFMRFVALWDCLKHSKVTAVTNT